MARVGINVNRDGRHQAGWIQTFNATGARIVVMQRYDHRPLFAQYQQQGIFPLLVLARESFEGFYSYAEGIDFYAQRYGSYLQPGQGAVQVGNEADHVSLSSWTMTPDELTHLGYLTRARLPHAYLVCAGMTSGHPSYLDQVDLSSFDAIAVHPYAKDLTRGNDLPDADVLVREYHRFGKPVWVTEWGWWGDEERGGYQVRDMISWAKNTNEIDWYFHFCADDLMVPPFGLLRADGTWKPAAQAFYEVMEAQEPTPEVGWIGDGLQQALTAHNWTPVSGEHVTTYPLVWAKTPTGKDGVIIWNIDRQEAEAYRRI